MAKKTFNIKRTLDVQPKQFSVEDIENAVKQIHDTAATKPNEQPAANPQPPEPAKEKKQVAAAKAASQNSPPSAGKRASIVEEGPVKKVRLSVDIHPAMHKRLKIKAIEHDSDIMHYVEMLIERDLAK